MELKAGDILKHFKGETLIEKNIYEVIAVNPTYTGDKDYPARKMLVYSSLFQNDKVFIRELDDLTAELGDDKKEIYHQEHRVDLLTDDELKEINTDEFRLKKLNYIKSKYS